MKNELLDNLSVIEENSYALWKGTGADIGAISKAIHDSSELVINFAESMPEEDRNATIQYVKQGLQDFERALDNRDEFMLADCLYFEWREIINIYIEVL